MSLNVGDKVFKESIIKYMQLMIPFVPHLAHECLELFNCKNYDKWPSIEKNIQNEIKFAIQINGKTRDIIKIKKDSKEKEVDKIVKNNVKLNKYFINHTITKTIFVKNKIINYIVKK